MGSRTIVCGDGYFTWKKYYRQNSKEKGLQITSQSFQSIIDSVGDKPALKIINVLLRHRRLLSHPSHFR